MENTARRQRSMRNARAEHEEVVGVPATTRSPGLLARALHRAGLAGRPLCLHSSLRSFGPEPMRADLLLDAFLDADCTILAPTFTSTFAAPPPAGHLPIPFNCEDDGSIPMVARVDHFTTDSTEVDPAMGALPAALLRRSGHLRGANPLSSFTALGGDAGALIAGQTALDVFAPLRVLARLGGAVVLAGVDLTAATILHLAEEQAGLRLLRRWAIDATGASIAVRHGGCSRGFERLAPHVAQLQGAYMVHGSPWRTFAAADLLVAATAVFAADPQAARCSHPECRRCGQRRCPTAT